MSLPFAQSQPDAITAACKRHHVARLHAFGSVLRPDYRPGESDIDLLVEFQALEPAELARAYFGLEQQDSPAKSDCENRHRGLQGGNLCGVIPEPSCWM